jgi:lipopolysaccharide export system protein LptA
MACKFRAFMKSPSDRQPPSLKRRTRLAQAVAVLSLVSALATPVHAERSDRLQRIVIEANNSGQLDLQKQVVTYTGNVVITQGTMAIRADRVEVRQLPSGYYTAVAFGAPNKPATFRQKRDGVDEYIEGEAQRLEYDGKTDTVKFVNRAQLRRLRGATVADEVSGNLITYDATTEKMNITGGGAPTAANPNSRVQAVLTPNDNSEAAGEIRAAAAAASAPLKTSPSIGTSAPAAKDKN